MRKIILCLLVLTIGCTETKYKTENYPNGKIKSEIPLIENKKNGVAKYYYEDGNIAAEAEFENDILIGDVKEYYASGKIYRKYNPNTLEALIFRDNQKSFYKGKFDNQELIMNGIWEEWLIDENYKRFEWTFKNGVIDGEYVALRKDGSIEVKGNYLKGQLNDTLFYFNDGNKCVKKEVWKANQSSSRLINTININNND